MCRSSVFWLPLVVVALVNNQGTSASPTRAQLRQLIKGILYEDKLYRDVLSERVKLGAQQLPPSARETVRDPENVDPLVTLHALNTPHQHYSGDDLDLSLTVLGTSIMCLTYKRMAVHLALIIRLIEETDGQAHFRMRARVFAHAVPYNVDMLSSIYSKFDNLLDIYHKVLAMMSSPDADADYEAHAYVFKQELETLNAVIDSSCVVNDMKQYLGSLKLKKLKTLKGVITDGHRISTSVNVDNCVEALEENENAIMNLYEEMDSLRNIDMGLWKTLLMIPTLPDKKVFERTPMPRYIYQVDNHIDTRGVYLSNHNHYDSQKMGKTFSSEEQSEETSADETSADSNSVDDEQ